MRIKYDINQACHVIFQEQLEKFGIISRNNSLEKVEINGKLTPEQFRQLEKSLKKYGIEFIDNSKSDLVQQIKEAITDLIYRDGNHSDIKLSVYLTGKLNLSYSYLSRIFSEATNISIENYMILQRVERAKQLISEENLTISEVAWKLNYSSLAHLSYQFKKTTGLTPTTFQRIIKRRSSSGFNLNYNHINSVA